MSEKLADLQQLIALSRLMQEQAQSESWDEVIRLEAIRREQISAFFKTPVEIEKAGPVSEGIQLIMAIDHDILALGCAEKLQLERALRQMMEGKKAVKAYSA